MNNTVDFCEGFDADGTKSYFDCTRAHPNLLQNMST